MTGWGGLIAGICCGSALVVGLVFGLAMMGGLL